MHGQSTADSISGCILSHHQLGNEGRDIYKDDQDRKQFIKILKENKVKFQIIFYCYVLMDNHYHLLIQTPLGNLASFMHDVNTAYAIFFNQKYKRVGYLFQGRYKALLVDKDNYFLHLTRYIHLNPVRAGLVKLPEEYPWSSYPGYIGAGKVHRWINYGEVFAYFSPNLAEARAKYREFLQSNLEDDDRQLITRPGHPAVLGDKSFVEAVLGANKAGNINGDKTVVPAINPKELIIATAFAFSTSPEKMMAKGDRYNLARQAAIYLVKRHCRLTNQESGALFGGLHHSAASKAYNRITKALQNDALLSAAIKKSKTSLKVPALTL